MHRLEFLNPVFQAGLNFTVRLGTKWADQVKPGDTVAIHKTGELKRVGLATIERMHIAPLQDLPTEVMRLEHDPGCRSFLGLTECMAQTYGKPIPEMENAVCTALGFRFMVKP